MIKLLVAGIAVPAVLIASIWFNTNTIVAGYDASPIILQEAIQNDKADDVAVSSISVERYPQSDIHTDEWYIIDTTISSAGVFSVSTADGSILSADTAVVVIGPGADEQVHSIEQESVSVVLPLTAGAGAYRIIIYEIEDNSISLYKAVTVAAFILDDVGNPWLSASMYATYDDSAAVVGLAAGMAAQAQSDVEYVRMVEEFITDNIIYNGRKSRESAKANRRIIQSADETLAMRSGICGDFAALMAAMLRSQGIHTRIVEGTFMDEPHAWIEYKIGGEWHMSDPANLNAAGGIVFTGGRLISTTSILSDNGNYTAYRYR